MFFPSHPLSRPFGPPFAVPWGAARGHAKDEIYDERILSLCRRGTYLCAEEDVCSSGPSVYLVRRRASLCVCGFSRPSPQMPSWHR